MSIIHDTSVIDDNVSIGVIKNLAFSHILSETIIGERCSFGQNYCCWSSVKDWKWSKSSK